MIQLNTIYQNDCIEFMNDRIDERSVHLIFADPPYNLSGNALSLEKNKTGGAYYKVNEQWDTFKYDDYVEFTANWMRACKKILVDNGSLYISCTQHNI